MTAPPKPEERFPPRVMLNNQGHGKLSGYFTSEDTFHLGLEPKEYLSATEHQALVKEAVAKAFGDCAAEAKRKYEVICRREDKVGHSAQSYGQAHAYDEITEWAERKAQEARKA